MNHPIVPVDTQPMLAIRSIIARRSGAMKQNGATKQAVLKALVVSDNSWYLSGGFHESVDRHLIDVKGLQVNAQDFHCAMHMIAEQAPDVLLLDSTLGRHFVQKAVFHVRDKTPSLPILLLPDIHDAVHQQEGPAEVRANPLRVGAAAGTGPGAAKRN